MGIKKIVDQYIDDPLWGITYFLAQKKKGI